MNSRDFWISQRPPKLEERRRSAVEVACLHGLFWLVLANAVGLLLASLSLFPQLNSVIAPLTYGRWMPLHLNFQLYGWLSFPLIALLLRAYNCNTAANWAKFSLSSWSLALAYGGLSWLNGGSSGKIFLEWQGGARLAFALALGVLWISLWLMYRKSQGDWTAAARWPRFLGLLVLLPVPLILYYSAGVGGYPPINPNSGGATGSSLLGSTLAIIALFLWAPNLLAQTLEPGRASRNLALLLGLHFLGFALLAGHGNRPNTEWRQILALGSLLIWVPLLIRHYRRFRWVPGCRVWLLGFAVWAGLLTLSGWLGFLPGILERWKFSHALVAHAHLAMAGMVTSFNLVVLISLCPQMRALARLRLTYLWQGGLFFHLLALMLLSELEASEPGLLFRRTAMVTLLFGLRWLAGCVMFCTSLLWLVQGRTHVLGSGTDENVSALEVEHRLA